MLCGLAFSLLSPPAARAHRLVAEFTVLPGQKVQVSCRYKVIPRSIPAVGARVRVYRGDDAVLVQGETDDQGQFVFAVERAEPLRVEAYQEGHRAEVQIDARVLGSSKEGDHDEQTGLSANRSQPKKNRENSDPPEENFREWLREILVGVGFLLALGAFLLSLRNAKHLREMQRKLNLGEKEKTKPATDETRIR
jgi:hypothetical protein